MRYTEIGGAKISKIGLGTWQFGSREWGYGEEYLETTALAITERALDLGVNLIDTAEIYGFGKSERAVGRAIAGRRAEAFVATKVFPVLPVGPVIAQRARASAARLGVDRIDLYQLHWPNPVVPVRAQVAGLGSLLEDGLVTHVGVSNYSSTGWANAERSLGRPVLTNQVQYSLLARAPEERVIPWAEANDRIVIAYSPLAQGVLAAKHDASSNPGGVRMGRFTQENLERAQPTIDALRDIAKIHDATPAQVALAWTIHHPNVVAIPGASRVEQLEANVAAADLELTDDDLARLDQASAGYEQPSILRGFADSVRTYLPF